MTKSIKENQYLPVLNDSLPEQLERLLSDEGIDWQGNMLGKSQYLSKRVPVISKNSVVYDQLIEAISVIEKLLEPANETDIIPLLVKLRLHFSLQHLSEIEISILINDYLEDISIYPIDIIEQACIDYRKCEKSLFFPKVGQILALIKDKWYKRRYKLQKLKKLLETSQLTLHG